MRIFEGRLTVKDYFLLLLACFIFYLVLITAMMAVADSAPIIELPLFVIGFFMFLLVIAGHVRRLHDIGMSGFWVLIMLPIIILLPFIGLLLCFPFLATKGNVESNKYGERNGSSGFLKRVFNSY